MNMNIKNELEKLGFTIVDETDNFFYMTLDRNEDEALYNASQLIIDNMTYSYREPGEMGELRDYDYKFPKFPGNL